MNGLESIVSGIIDSDVKKVTGVPGYPITDLMEALGDIRHEWSVNEKVALEMALGSSICGERCAVITKHVGMNILSDPLVTSAIHTIGAGVVIFAGDDPGIEKSQNEQDSRYYGLVAEVPVFDPGTTENAYNCVKEAFILSEKARTPVIIRLTDRLLKSNGNFVRKREPYQPKIIDKKIWHLTMLGKHERFHNESYPQMCKYAETSKLNAYKKNKKKNDIGIISSGFPSSLVDSIISDNISHLSLTIINPLPIDLIDRFIKEHSRVLIVEETEPVIEKQFSKRVFGKLTGHMPYGIAKIEDIKKALENIDNDALKCDIVPQTLEKRGPRPMCEDCPYMPLYFAIKELDVPVAGDLGCSIMTSSPPLSLIDAAFSLGSSISTACGFNRKGIAIIGDFGLAHSGIPALINAVHNEHEVVVVVLQNEVAAMTGGQKVPDLTGLLSYYIKDTVTVNPDDKNIRKILNEKLEKNGVSVILAPAKCPRY
ncbi:Indolepyruvate oxidoreductase subunit IorA [uncultured archaeon]|nr:Indolepyruvate oxidoreductase subunit IorA [uncultured archaeon]